MRVIKIIFALLLLLCLLKMPYGYYQFVRLASMIIFSWLAYESYQRKEMAFVFIYIGLAVLFQPIIKIALGREIWNIVDVIVAVFLLITLLPKFNKPVE